MVRLLAPRIAAPLSPAPLATDLPVRIIEVSWYNDHSIWSASPSQINFLLFVALFTLLSLLYLALAPRFAPRASHPFAILALDAILWVFWFAGWVALAVFHNRLNLCWGNVCRVMVAAIVIGALEWYVDISHSSYGSRV